MKPTDKAFPSGPRSMELQANTTAGSAGITARDFAAIHCLQGIIASPEFASVINTNRESRDIAAKIAYEFADALIRASESKS